MRTLVAAHASDIPTSKSEAQVTSLTEFLQFVNHLKATAFEEAGQLACIEVQFVKELGKSILVPEELFSAFVSLGGAGK